MEQKRCGFAGLCCKFKAHFLMILVQLGFTILSFITEASFIHGFNPYVYVTYRCFVAGLSMLPFAYFLERKMRPKLTLALFLEIFVLSLLGYTALNKDNHIHYSNISIRPFDGNNIYTNFSFNNFRVSLSLNLHFASLKYTNPTFVTVMCNTVSSMTFVLAVILRIEVINLRNPRSVAKVVGTLVSFGGIMIVTLYRGPIIRNVWPPLIRIHKKDQIHEEWLKGSLLVVANCIAWAIWYLMQAYSLKRYPAQLSLTTWMSLLGGIQSAIFTVIMEHNISAWTIGFNIDLWSILYSGVVGSGLLTFIQVWCTEEKGPVFVTMFNPLPTIFAAVLSYFVVGDKLHMGCIVGGMVVLIGMYLLIWGKEEEKEGFKCTSNDAQKQSITRTDELPFDL